VKTAASVLGLASSRIGVVAPPAERHRVLRDSVIAAKPAGTHQLVVGYRSDTFGKVILTVTAEHIGERVALESRHVLNLA
jgi:hypothetical protein